MLVTVIYADLSVKVAPIGFLESIDHAGVLHILVHTIDEELLFTASGSDMYAVCWGSSAAGRDWVWVLGQDAGDFGHHHIADYIENHDERMPLGCTHSWFDGVSVTDRKWAESLRVFNGLLR